MSEPAPSPFSANIPHFLTHWNSTALGLYKECEYKFFMMAIEGWVPRSKGIHLMFGGLYAAGLEHYAHYRAQGQSHDTASVNMVRWVLGASGTRTESGEFEPWSPGDHPDANLKNRYTLTRSLIWNVEDRLSSPFQTYIMADGRPAVELTFNFAAFEIGGESVHLCGHLDEVVTERDDLWVRDDKTTKGPLGARYFQQFSPNNQMSLYSIAGKVILGDPVRGVLVKAAQIGVGFTRYQTQQVPRPKAVLDAWMKDTEYRINSARLNALSGVWPQNDKSCGNYGGCPFQQVCSVSPSHRRAWLEADFIRHPFNPLEQRGEF